MEKKFLWWRDGIIYQIYPRSYVDANGDGIGDLQGIISKLEYLQWLGISGIWLSPIYPSPDVDFGYDVADYLGIDPKFGTMQDFEQLITGAKKHNIHILMDLVLNHTSDQHPWFKASRSSRDDPYHNWYLWKDPNRKGGYPNNWQSVFGGPGWEFVPEIGQYYYHMFYKQQPDVNWRNPDVRKAMLDVFRFWLNQGVDGFRLDVFNLYFKDADMRDNPPALGIRGFDRQNHIYDTDQPEMIPLLKEIRQIMDSKPETYVVGETFNSTPAKAARYCAPGLLHAAFNFSMLQNHWSSSQFLKKIQDWEKVLQNGAWPNNVLSNHDTSRIAKRFARGEDDSRLKLLAAMLLTLRGTPFIYYGDEIGMRDLIIHRKEIQDPVGKQFWPIYAGRDGCRGPMQWIDQKGSGFSSSKPWLKMHPDYTFRNVETLKDNKESLLWFYKNLMELRKSHPALINGMFLPINEEPRYLLAYLRKTNDETILVALNFSRKPMKLFLGRELASAKWTLLLSSKRGTLELQEHHFISILGEEACLLHMDG